MAASVASCVLASWISLRPSTPSKPPLTLRRPLRISYSVCAALLVTPYSAISRSIPAIVLAMESARAFSSSAAFLAASSRALVASSSALIRALVSSSTNFRYTYSSASPSTYPFWAASLVYSAALDNPSNSSSCCMELRFSRSFAGSRKPANSRSNDTRLACDSSSLRLASTSRSVLSTVPSATRRDTPPPSETVRYAVLPCWAFSLSTSARCASIDLVNSSYSFTLSWIR